MAILIPLKSLVSQTPTRVFVVVPEGNSQNYRTEIRDVVLGRVNGEQVEVLDGIKEGDIIISEKMLTLDVGQIVTPTFPSLEKPIEEKTPSSSPNTNTPSVSKNFTRFLSSKNTKEMAFSPR